MLTDQDRAARRDRYKELDPDHRWQRLGYDYLTDETGLRLKQVEPDRDFDDVIGATQWGATPPVGPLEARGELRQLILHHTAIRYPAMAGDDPASVAMDAAEAAYMRRIERLHLDRGWSAVGYHFVIMPSGRVFEGRPLCAIGAHAAGHNRASVGIALAGNFEEERPPPAAIRSLEAFERRFALDGRPLPLTFHGDLMRTVCPGRLLREALSARATFMDDAAVR
jgi:hypothetical protein